MSGINQGLLASLSGRPEIIGHTTAYAPSSSSITINTPAGTGPNDLLIAFITATTTRNPFSSSGWSLQYGSGSFPNGYARQSCLTQQLSAAPSANYTFSTNNTADITAVMIAIRPSSAVGTSAIKTFSTASSTSHIAPSVTASRSGLLLCGFGFDRSASSGMTASTPSGMTQVAYNVGTGTDNYRATLVCSEQVSFGATGTRTSTTSQSVQSFIGSLIISTV